MRPILDTNKLDQAERELGLEPGGAWQLVTPLTGYLRVRRDAPFAIDNGAFTRFDEARFLAVLEREREHRRLCRFVAVPDVIAAGRTPAGRRGRAVGNANLTLQVFHHWRRRKELVGWDLAYVAQNGAEAQAIPWHLIACLFIGGDDAFKDGPAAAQLVKAAKMMGKHVHVGRVNDKNRLAHFEALGADSWDGSGVARTTWQRLAIAHRGETPLFHEAA